jgi:hypothetical protein
MRCFLSKKFPQGMFNTLNERALLEVFKIAPTDIRIHILSVIRTQNQSGPFSEDILAGALRDGMKISKSSLTNIIRLFVVRGLLQSIDPKKTPFRGRPQSQFIISDRANQLFTKG